MDTPEPKTSNQPAVTADVPARLVDTAINLYGARGTHAVSTREIQRQAGILNEAAVRYYFGNKAGLLQACLAEIARRFAPIAERGWQEVEDKREKSLLNVSDVIGALVQSIYSLYLRSPNAVLLLARMIREEGGDGQDLLLEHFGDLLWRLEGFLGDMLPGKSADALRLHVFMALHSAINGVVDSSLLWRLPATGTNDSHFRLPGDKLARGFVEFVAAGVSATSDI